MSHGDGKHEPAREYSNGEVVVIWQSGLCIHSAVCIRGLPAVFDVRRRPWIDVSGGSTEEIVAQVGRCPSGALSLRTATGEDRAAVPDAPPAAPAVVVDVSPNGPLLVRGRIVVKAADGTLEERSETTALCRCGGSAKKPYCDGSHRRNGFAG